MNMLVWSRSSIATLLVIALAVFFNTQEFFSRQTGIGWLSFIDDVVVCSAFIVGPLFIRRRRDLWVLALLLFPLTSIVYGLAINVFIHGPPRVIPVVVQSVVTFKLFLIYVVFFALKVRAVSSAPFASALMVVSVITFAGLALNFVIPDLFVFSDHLWHAERGRIVGFQFKPNDAAILLALIFAVWLFYMKGRLRPVVLMICFAGVLANTSRAALVIILGSVVWHLVSERRYGACLALMTIGIAVGALFIEDISNSFAVTETAKNLGELSFVGETQYIRAVMVANGFILALNWFPIGVGPAHFGTVMSVDSPVYGQLGLSGLGALDDMSGIYDSNIASLLGEYGFVGFIIIFFAVFIIFKRGFPYRNSMFFFSALMWVALTQPVFGYQVNAINFLLVLFAIEKYAKGQAEDSGMRGVS